MFKQTPDFYGGNRRSQVFSWIFAFVMMAGMASYTNCIAAASAEEQNASAVANKKKQSQSRPETTLQPVLSNGDAEIDSRSGRRRMTPAEREILKKELREAMEKANASDMLQ